jgi:hypothetical protein
MIYECTDCEHCASFHAEFRVFCLHPDLPANEVCKYQPLGQKDAFDWCDGFSDGSPEYFSWDHLVEAESYSEEQHGEVTYEGIREWCEKEVKKRKEKYS